MEQASPLTFLADIGVCFVGIFFFFSGYGLLKSLNTKPDYLHHFLRKRLPVILVPFYITIVVFLIVSKMLGASYETTEFISYLTGWKLINSHMWYIVEIFLLYIIFFVIFRLIKNRGVALTMMSILVVLLTVGSLLLGHGDYWFQGEWWFNTSFLFVIGMLIAQFEAPLIGFVKKCYLPLLAVVAVSVIALYHATSYMLTNYSYWSESPYSMGYADKFRCLSVQLPFVICFVLLILIVTMKIQFKNRILDFLGSISLELYMIHNLFLILFSAYGCFPIASPFLYTIASLGCAIVSAFLLHLLDQWLIGRIGLIAKA